MVRESVCGVPMRDTLPPIDWCLEYCSGFARECTFRTGGRLYHNIRKNIEWEKCWRIDVPNHTGCGFVEVYTPKNPTQDEIDATRVFLIEELDSFDALDEYERLLEKVVN
jgi:hypothetical protein